jgi:vitamin B12 transporter
MKKKLQSGFFGLGLMAALTLAPMAHLSAEEVDEIVVSATGIPTPLAQIGASVDVITAEDLERQQITYLQDALKLKGINVPQTGGLGSLSNVFLRGLPGKYTDLRVDGISLFDPRSNQVLWGDVIPQGVGQIEILRGSQGVLYGSNTIAGVISQATAIGGETSSKVHVEVGSFDSSNISLTSRGESDRAAYGFALGILKTDGVSAAAKELGNTEKDGYENDRFNGRAAFYLGDALSIEVAGRFAQGEVESDARFLRTDEIGKSEKFERMAGRVAAVYEGDRMSHTIDLVRYESEVEEFSNFVSAAMKEADRDVLSYRGVFDVSENYKLVIGAEDTKESFTESGTSEIDVTSIYALARGEFLDSLTATVAVRRDDHSIFGYQDTYRFTAAAAASERVSFRAAYGTGFRAPSLTELFLEVYGNDNLKPETSESRELGVDWRDEENQLSLTVFSLDVDDIIGYDPATFANRQIEGTSKVLGLEASINWRLSEHLYASANANYTDSDKPLSSGNGGDEREVRVPRRQIQANADYTIDRNSQIGITVRRIEGVVDVGNIKLDDYTLVDLRGDFQITESLKANARLENAFDEEYETVKGFGTLGRAFYVGVSTRF